MTYQGLTALITGASMGLGEAFARELASRGVNLILVARSEDKLSRLAESLGQAGKIEVTVLPADLSSADSVQGLIAEIRRRNIHIDLLINNAGVGVFQNFLDTPVATQAAQVQVNVEALLSLTYAFTPGMIAARCGGVINIASTAAFQPLAGATVYSASKAFVLFFSEGLSLELKGTGVTVIAACPGPVATHFFADKSPKLKAKQMDQPGPIVADVLRGFEQRKTVVYPGRLSNRLNTWGGRFLPRETILRLAVRVTKELNQK